MRLPASRKVWGWGLYYWGNHAFTTSIITVFFPIFFKDYWSAGADVTLSTFRLGLANSIASLVVAVSAPVRGAIADRGGRATRFLAAPAFCGARRRHAVRRDVPAYPRLQAGVRFPRRLLGLYRRREHGDPDGGRLRQVDRLRHGGPDPRRAARAVRWRARGARRWLSRQPHRAAAGDLHRPRRVRVRVDLCHAHDPAVRVLPRRGNGGARAGWRAAPEPLVF